MPDNAKIAALKRLRKDFRKADKAITPIPLDPKEPARYGVGDCPEHGKGVSFGTWFASFNCPVYGCLACYKEE